MYKAEEYPEHKTAVVERKVYATWTCKAQTIEEASVKSERLTEVLNKRMKDGKVNQISHLVLGDSTNMWKKVSGIGVDYETATQLVTCFADVTVEIDVEYEAWREEPTDTDIDWADGRQTEGILIVQDWDLELS